MEKKIKDRNTLKEYFQTGNIPSAEQFAQLIDSVPNILDDRCEKKEKEISQLFPKEKGEAFASIYAAEPTSQSDKPYWYLHLNEHEELEVRNKANEAVITIEQNKKVTMHGSSKSEGGETEYMKIPADGKWHDLPVEAAATHIHSGCRVYQLFASYNDTQKYSYAMCEAVVSHKNQKGCKIASSQKHWWGWSGQIKLRWYLYDDQLFLQMRSKGNKKGVESIYYQITELWNFTDSE